jgi:ectoine hydroxylase-related dioxygenase (phytanoyl-CoA dioxygenase family)
VSTATSVSDEQLREWTANGYFRIDGFADRGVCDAMLERAREIVRAQAAGEQTAGLILPEANKVREGASDPADPTDYVSKIFKLHRDPVFEEFALRPPLLDLLCELIAPDIDVFLSQFIFKTPGAWGQPWHQDSYYFPFEPARPIVGVWLAVTEATLENGCLHVLDGSHREPIHEHVRDQRPGANYGYVEIVDHDTAASRPVLMQPGDLLVFDSHLMHRSTDNTSPGIRGAMVYHYARAGTVDRAEQKTPVNDWMPARRA